MSIYKSSEQLTEVLQDLWTSVLADQTASDRLEQGKITIASTINDPDATIWIGPPNQLLLGDDAKDKDSVVHIEMTGDVAHKLYSKKLSVATALALRKIKVKGPVTELLKLMPIIDMAIKQYPATCEKFGIA